MVTKNTAIETLYELKKAGVITDWWTDFGDEKVFQIKLLTGPTVSFSQEEVLAFRMGYLSASLKILAP